MPSAVALRIHSCVAKIIEKTGIAEQLNEVLEDDCSNLRYLSSNGSVTNTTLHNSILLRLWNLKLMF